MAYFSFQPIHPNMFLIKLLSTSQFLTPFVVDGMSEEIIHTIFRTVLAAAYF